MDAARYLNIGRVAHDAILNVCRIVQELRGRRGIELGRQARPNNARRFEIVSSPSTVKWTMFGTRSCPLEHGCVDWGFAGLGVSAHRRSDSANAEKSASFVVLKLPPTPLAVVSILIADVHSFSLKHTFTLAIGVVFL